MFSEIEKIHIIWNKFDKVRDLLWYFFDNYQDFQDCEFILFLTCFVNWGIRVWFKHDQVTNEVLHQRREKLL